VREKKNVLDEGGVALKRQVEREVGFGGDQQKGVWTGGAKNGQGRSFFSGGPPKKRGVN